MYTKATEGSGNDGRARPIVVLALAGLLMTAGGRAGAETAASTPTVVFATYVGEAPDKEPAELMQLRGQLEAHGFLARPASIMPTVGANLPWLGVMDPGSTPTGLTRAELLDAVEVGYQSWAAARFDDAVKQLTHAIMRMRRNPALLVTDTSNLAVVYKAYLTLALSLAKLDRAEESEKAMAQLIRAFPSQPIVRSVAGPEAWELYRTVLRSITAQGRGRLTINTNDDQAIIFVDGQLRGTKRVELTDVLPGPHDVFIQVVGTLGRQYRVDVFANKSSTLALDWDLDQITQLSEREAALVFASSDDRSHEAQAARGLLRRWNGHQVALISVRRQGEKVSLVGSIYDSTGTLVRSGRVAIVRSSVDTSELAAFLAGKGMGEHIEVIEGGRGARFGRSPRQTARWFAPTALVAGLGITLAGPLAFRVSDYRPDPPLSHPRRFSFGVSTIGGALVGTSTYWIAHDRYGLRPLPSALLGGAAGALCFGAALLAMDEASSPDRPTRIDSAAPGIVLASAGVAMGAAGLWFALRPSSKTPPPALHASAQETTITWGMSF